LTLTLLCDIMDSMNRPSKRILRYMKLAAKVAQDSVYNDYRHGALLIRGGSVLNWSENKNQYCGFGNRFRQYNTGLPTVHAELGCILGVDKSKTKNATIYVARIGKAGDWRLSKPCAMCMAAAKFAGVRQIVYTIEDGEVGTAKL